MDANKLQNIKDYNYFVNIRVNIDLTKSTNINEHYQCLSLAFLVYQSPVLTSFYSSCKILTKNILYDNVNYFILRSKRGKNSVKISINKDKASNYKIYNQNKQLSKIYIENTQLINSIHNSYEIYLRFYLFENIKKRIYSFFFANFYKLFLFIILANFCKLYGAKLYIYITC